MTPKERRERLFKDVKPNVRKAEEEDLKWLYGAHCYPNPPGDKDDQIKFFAKLQDILNGYDEAFILEDRNKKFKNNWGPVGIVPSMYNGWVLEPHVEWFPWATTLNKVRSTVAFIMFARYSQDVGVTIYNSLKETKDFFKGLKNYAPIYFINKVPYGDPRGDNYLFYTRGKKRS